jgi:hypothetical protein
MAMHRRISQHTKSDSRRGQVLVEFALIALVMYLLLAAVITFGHALYAAQGIQQIADFAAREISRTPLAANKYTLVDVLYDADATDPQNSDLLPIRRRIFDQHYLVIDANAYYSLSDEERRAYLLSLPLVNQQLFPLMISDTVGGKRLLHYPGALYPDPNPVDDPESTLPLPGYLVAVPLLRSDATGTETIDWRRVIEPIGIDRIASGDKPDPFLITSEEGGIVALRINYPFQAAAMSAFRENPAGGPNIGNSIIANDAGVAVVDNDGFSPTGSTGSDSEFGPYSGAHALGRQAAFGSPQMAGSAGVRPYRRLITAQAIYRREIFGP